jgi:hypothetical protein
MSPSEESWSSFFSGEEVRPAFFTLRLVNFGSIANASAIAEDRCGGGRGGSSELTEEVFLFGQHMLLWLADDEEVGCEWVAEGEGSVV